MEIQPTDALIVLDVQKDFCPGGALAIEEGDEVVPVINRVKRHFTHVVFTRDWHPENHCSFSTNPDFQDGSWPPHCVQNTAGAEFHFDLIVPHDAWIVSKGTELDSDAYSGFQESSLAEDLEKKGINRVFVCGLATDVCVKSTALDARKLGFDVVVIEDACRGVDVPIGSAAKAIEEMKAAGVQVCQSGDIA